ncbi:MAG: hypothetical protein Q9170_004039 [Blastenia crenularia]
MLVAYPLSSSNLTLPPQIPSFETRLNFGREPTLNLLEVYTNTIEMMAYLAAMPWDLPILLETRITGMGYIEEIVIRPWPKGVQGLQTKHCTQAAYEAGFALARIAITKRGFVPKVFAGLFLQGRQIGYMKWQSLMRGQAGRLDDVVNITATTPQIVKNIIHKGEKTGTLVYRGDPKFAIKYTLFEEEIYLPDIWTAFIDALASAAPHDASTTAAYVDAVGVSGGTVLHIHASNTPSKLTWRMLNNGLLTIWDAITKNHWFQAWEFELTYESVKIGEGEIWNMRTARSSSRSLQ